MDGRVRWWIDEVVKSSLGVSSFIVPPIHGHKHLGKTSFFAVQSPRFFISGYCIKRSIQGSFDSFSSRFLTSRLSQENQYLASILSNTFVTCICHNISCALGKWSLHSRWNFISTFTELRVHGDEHWPTEVTSNTYFRDISSSSSLSRKVRNTATTANRGNWIGQIAESRMMHAKIKKLMHWYWYIIIRFCLQITELTSRAAGDGIFDIHVSDYSISNNTGVSISSSSTGGLEVTREWDSWESRGRSR